MSSEDLLPDPAPVNMSGGVAHHAVVYPDQSESCACGNPWPCSEAPALNVHPVPPPPGPAEVVHGASSSGLPWTAVADALGVPQDDVVIWLQERGHQPS